MRSGLHKAGRRAVLAAALLAGAGCSYFPQAVGGVPSTEPWVALPLRQWLAEGRAVPEAVAACFDRSCPHRLAVGVVRVTGDDVDTLSALLDDPAALARGLTQPDSLATDHDKPAKRAVIEVSRLQAQSARGFAITLRHADSTRRPAYGAVLGRRSGEALRLVMVMGDEAVPVQDTARRVAAEHLGP